MTKGPGYTQTKIKVCQQRPFQALGALGMWYSYCLEAEMHKWRSAHASAALASGAKDMAAFCEHPSGFHIRRVLSDGVLIQVYDRRNQLLADTLLPVAVPGQNLTLLELSQVVPFLKKRGAFYCRFPVDGMAGTGHVLEGHSYCAAWSDDERGFLFEIGKGRNPNGQILERLD